MAEREVYINVELGLESREFQNELDKLEREIEPIEVPVEFKLDPVKEVISEASQIVEQINSAVSKLNSLTSSLSGAIASGGSNIAVEFEKILDSMNQKIESSLKGLLNAAVAPFRSIITGFFEQIGMSFSSAFSQAFVTSIEKRVGASMEGLGQKAGDSIANILNKIFTKNQRTSGAPPPRETAKYPGVEDPWSSAEQFARQVKSPTANRQEIARNIAALPPATKELQNVQKGVAEQAQEQIPELYKQIFQQTLKAANQKNIGSNLLPRLIPDLEPGVGAKYTQSDNAIHISRAAYEKLKSGSVDLLGVENLAHEFRHALQLNFGQQGGKLGVNLLRGTKQELKELETLINASTTKAGEGQTQSVIAQIRRLETDAYVFARRNAQAIYDAVAGKPANPQLQKVKNDLAKLQDESVRKLAQENARAIEQLTRAQLRQIAKSAGIKGVSNLKVADLRQKLQQEISPDELSFRIPAFSKVSPEIQQLAQKIAKLPQEKLQELIKSIFQNNKEQISKNTKQINTKEVTEALNSIQRQRQIYASVLAQDLDKQTRNTVQAALARLGKQQIALESRLRIGMRQERETKSGTGQVLPQGVSLYSMAAPPPQADLEPMFQEFFKGAVRKFYEQPGIANMEEKERREIIAEAIGYMFSGPALANPIQTALSSLAPIALPLTPIIAAGALAANIVVPIVTAVTDALKRIEPVQRRLASIAGGREGAKREDAFARETAREFNLNTFTAIDAYSKLFAATKNTNLEGEKTRELFTGISAATKALGMDAESARLTMYAFTQMAAKGTISMEELRQQLGEKFPPALDIFAKAAGVSQAELGALVSSGKLLSVDILPKVARQLISQYGNAAKQSANDFISAQTRVDNAIFGIQEKLAKQLGPAIAAATSMFANSLNFLAENMEGILKVAQVVFIGLTAQFLVGTATIVGQLQIVKTAIAAIVPVYGAAFAMLTPMFVGIATDMVDEVVKVFNKKSKITSAIKNISLGFYNFFYGAGVMIFMFAQRIQEAFESITSASNSVSISFAGVGNAIRGVFSIIPNFVIEWTALTLMLAQTAALLRMAVMPMFADMLLSLKSLAVSFIATAKAGGIFKVTLNTLRAGLTSTQFATMGVLSAFLLLFSKADFNNRMGKQFDEFKANVVSGSQQMREALGLLRKEVEKLPEKFDEFESQGFDLTLGLGQQFGGGAFRTDDVIKFLRGEQTMRDMLKKGQITQQEFDKFMVGARQNASTFGEMMFTRNLLSIDETRQEINKAIDDIGILSGSYSKKLLGNSIATVKRFDAEIKALQQQRVEIASSEDFIVNKELQSQIKTLDSRIKTLLKNRESTVKPFRAASQQLDSFTSELNNQVAAIEKRTDIPKTAKAELKSRLENTINIVEQARSRLQKVGVKIIPDLGIDFQALSTQMESEEKLFGKLATRRQLILARNNAGLQKMFTSGQVSEQLFSKGRNRAEQEILEERVKALNSFILTRREQIKQLMLLPEPTREQQEFIAKNQELILKKEEEYYQAVEELNKRKQEQANKEREERIKDFEEAATIQESYRKAGLVNEQQAVEALLRVRTMQAEEELQQIRDKRAKMLKTDKEGLEALAVQEAEVYARLAEATKARYQEQFNIIESASTRANDFLEAQRERGTRSELNASQEAIRIATQQANAQLLLVRQALDDTPATDTARRDELLVQQQKAMAIVAKARKTAYTVAIKDATAFRDTELAIAQSHYSRSNISETEFHHYQYDLNNHFYDEQLKIIRKRRQELNENDIDGHRELNKAEAEIYKQRGENQKAFLDAQLKQLESSQANAKDIATLAAKEREIEIQKLVNAGVLIQEEAQYHLNDVRSDSIRQELELEENKLRQLQQIKYQDQTAERERQAQIRASRIKTSELTLELLKQERTQQEAFFAIVSKFYEQVDAKIANAATKSTQGLEKQLRLNQGLEKSLELQNNLLAARNNLFTALNNYLDTEINILKETAKTEEEKKEIAEAAANAKIRAARLQNEIEQKTLEIEIKQSELALQRLQTENAIAQIRNKADVARKQVVLRRVQQDPNATPEQIEAAQLELQASITEGQGLQQQSQLLRQQQANEAEVNQLKRRTQQLEQSAEIRRLEFDAANAIADEFDRDRALERLRNSAARRVFGTEDFMPNVEQLNRFNRGDRLTPLQTYFAQQGFDALNRNLPTVNPTTKIADVFGNQIDKFGEAVQKFMGFVDNAIKKPNNVTINAPITNNIESGKARQTASDTAGAFRQQMYDLGLELNRA